MEAQDPNYILSKKRKSEEQGNAINVKKQKTLSHPSENITLISFFSDLPDDIITHILKHMDDGTLARFSITAKSLSLSLISLTDLAEKEFKERSPLKIPLALSFSNGQPFKHSYFLREGFWNVLENIRTPGSMNSLKKRFYVFKFYEYCCIHQFIISEFIKSIIFTSMYEDVATKDAKKFRLKLSKSFFSQNPIALEVELAFKCKKLVYGFKYRDEDYNEILFDISESLVVNGFDEVAYYYAQYLDESRQFRIGFEFYQKTNMNIFRKYWKLAANHGHAGAQYNLGLIYEEEGNRNKAKRYLKLAADQGYANAQINLGFIYEEEGKINEAKKYNDFAAKQGNVVAQYSLGLIYEKEGNRNKAKKYYKLAADQILSAAQYNLGFMYNQEGNRDEAKKYFKLAANQGDDDARNSLGLIYEKEGNRNKAKKYYKLAANHGHAGAQYNRGLIYEEEGNLDKAKKYYKLAADQGDENAQNNLGYIHEYKEEYVDAMQWYEEAAKKGSLFAHLNIGYLYKHGLGVLQNEEKAAEFYEKGKDALEDWKQARKGFGA
jgi:TPR repeat protein